VSTLIEKNSRRQSRAVISLQLSKEKIIHSPVADKIQGKFLAQLQNQGNIIHDRFIEESFTTIGEALARAVYFIEEMSSDIVVAMPYNVKEGAAFLFSKDELIRGFKISPFILSDDGAVILDSEGRSGLILDYHGTLPESAADLIILGLATDM